MDNVHLVIKVFFHLMQKTAVDGVPTATGHQTKWQIFPDLTFFLEWVAKNIFQGG